MRLLGILFVCALCFAQPDTATYFSVPPVDAPELAPRGPWAVGVRTVELVNPNQPDIIHFDRDSGKAPVYDRPLTLEIWYPATIPAGKAERVVYESAMPGAPRPGVADTFQILGKALRDAPPVSGQNFPLVVVSHGYPGSRTFMTWLTENLASKGYVVAAIDHTDSVFGQQRAFSSTLLNRAADQIFAIDTLTERSKDSGDILHNVIDPSRVAVVGYSMGGYGALATAGAGYSRQGGAAQAIPGGYFDRWLADSEEFQSHRREQIKAVVAIAPWGNQPPQNNWDAQGLAGIHIPSLFIAGDQDDVSGFEQGTRKAFNGAVNSERYLLVFQNARHNVGGNPAPAEAFGNFTSRAFFDEPVWRKDRVAAINQHFITAFLDLYVKGNASRREYLTLPVKSPVANQVWKGFQPRWALGIEWYRYAAGQEAGSQ
jgi:predicted dienelactone hydrolase